MIIGVQIVRYQTEWVKRTGRVRLLSTSEPVQIGDIVITRAVTRRHSHQDPTAHLPTKTTQDEIWVAIAGHLGLQCWHPKPGKCPGRPGLRLPGNGGAQPDIKSRVAYSGPWPAAIDQINAGHVLLVEIETG